MKAFFFKIRCFFIIFSKFSKFNFFPICAKKNLKNKVERYFEEKYHLRRILEKFATCSDFEKFHGYGFSKKNSLFFIKKPKFRTFWEFLLFQSHSTTIFLQFGGKKISRSDVNKNPDVGLWRERNWQTSGKKTSEIVHLRRFCLHILNMAQNNKTAKTWRDDLLQS